MLAKFLTRALWALPWMLCAALAVAQAYPATPSATARRATPSLL
jgi:hypothetical protein